MAGAVRVILVWLGAAAHVIGLALLCATAALLAHAVRAHNPHREHTLLRARDGPSFLLVTAYEDGSTAVTWGMRRQQQPMGLKSDVRRILSLGAHGWWFRIFSSRGYGLTAAGEPVLERTAVVAHPTAVAAVACLMLVASLIPPGGRALARLYRRLSDRARCALRVTETFVPGAVRRRRGFEVLPR